ncbi:hypothetical protein LUZ62_042143 [Rhynchospora pubera]|uniref:Morc S5 domain-containing protein n=1 Tax=Rhynchospora pubera TaxID=906938 RepID=A0AAV8FC37_9POAL|nr:hypothetical protein LUZ62_042143 [Rhynchospora pubera]
MSKRESYLFKRPPLIPSNLLLSPPPMASRPPPIIKEEIPSSPLPSPPPPPSSNHEATVIDLSSSDSEDSDRETQQKLPDKRSRASNGEESSHATKSNKKPRNDSAELPIGFLAPLPLEKDPKPLPLPPPETVETPSKNPVAHVSGSKQFWKAGDYYDESPNIGSSIQTGMDHVRVHPKFLHSNATSHKWALGALAELLDNALDEVANGATFVNIDVLLNKKDNSRMLLVEDNGGGMDPDKMRQCMSLGYSAKCKMANTIGQYGNGFKTSTMRLGADVIVFSRSSGKDGKRPTQSIGMLSYTFLRSTGKEDIVVPMLDYEKNKGWERLERTNMTDWQMNLDTIVTWSPYLNEADLLNQFSSIEDHGTRIIIYNLWEDDYDLLELDFDSDPHDILLRGVNRDENNIKMAKQFPNSRHFLTYRHSLRSYASILYLRLPHVFRMILRGKDIEHHNIVNDMMLKQNVTYRPQSADGSQKDPNMVAVVTIGFVKDAKHHINVQGFNVYHKNRLIKPFWRVWTASGSGGRGVLGVLEANFIEPAHDKQDFERTTILSRLESRLIQMQKSYWNANARQIGYVGNTPSRKKETESSGLHDDLPEGTPQQNGKSSYGRQVPRGLSASPVKSGEPSNPSRSYKTLPRSSMYPKRTKNRDDTDTDDDSDTEYKVGLSGQSRAHLSAVRPTPSPIQRDFLKRHGGFAASSSSRGRSEDNMGANGVLGDGGIARSHYKGSNGKGNAKGSTDDDSESIIKQLRDENEALQDKISDLELKMMQELQIERDKNRVLTEQLEEVQRKLEETQKEQEALIDIFSEERTRRDKDEENLRKKLKESSATIQELLEERNASRSNRNLPR